MKCLSKEQCIRRESSIIDKRQTDSSMTADLRRSQALMLEFELWVLSCSFHRRRGGKNINMFSFLVLICPLVKVSSECSVKVINKDICA